MIFIPRIFYQIRGLVIFFSLHRCLHHRTINILAAPVCTTPPVYKIVVHHCSTAPAIFTLVHTAPPSRWKDIAPVQHRTAKLMNDIAPVQHHTAPQNFLAAPGAVRTGAAPVRFAPHPWYNMNGMTSNFAASTLNSLVIYISTIDYVIHIFSFLLWGLS